jgi:hypothetical protein
MSEHCREAQTDNQSRDGSTAGMVQGVVTPRRLRVGAYRTPRPLIKDACQQPGTVLFRNEAEDCRAPRGRDNDVGSPRERVSATLGNTPVGI